LRAEIYNLFNTEFNGLVEPKILSHLLCGSDACTVLEEDRHGNVSYNLKGNTALKIWYELIEH
jgi:hypothetical protein